MGTKPLLSINSSVHQQCFTVLETQCHSCFPFQAQAADALHMEPLHLTMEPEVQDMVNDALLRIQARSGSKAPQKFRRRLVSCRQHRARRKLLLLRWAARSDRK